jgi:LuxR family transcriptional regulator, maltose regulon positive regulatory protein
MLVADHETRTGRRATGGSAVFPRTKFHRAPVREEHVERLPLLSAMEDSHTRIVVLTAPPGFGKSTLLAQCAARSDDPDRVVWVSLDADDSGPRLFSAILTGLRDLLGPGLDAALDAAEAPDADIRQDVLIVLLDALAATPAPVTLILDDLHLALEEAATREQLDWLLARLPSTHRVLLATRRELGLDSLRHRQIRGEVLELRAADLRFGEDEVLRFLCDGLGLEIGPEQVARLERGTEGWPAALYLAALRLRRGDDVDAVAEQLAGRDEDLFGALTDEVLRSTPERERRFILELAVLDRFNADLCARVLGDEATTRGAFRRLTRTSLLLSPLDRGRTWFRCHHLLRDVLHARLLAEDPERARTLHVRAGAWFESEGGESELHEAMRHYLAAEAWDLAAELLTRHSVRFVQSGALGGRAREWLAQFPDEVVRGDARLGYVSAVLAALDGDHPRADAWLREAERAGWEGPMPDGTASLRLSTLCLTAMICFDDVGRAITAASQALAALPAGSPMRSAVQSLSAWHAYLLGRHEDAERLARDALAGHVHLSSAGLPLVAYLPSAVLGLIACDRGELEAAGAFVEEAVRARDSGPLRGAPHTLPVTCASARLATLRGEPSLAVARCRAGLELAREWRDSSLMVPAALLELARAQQALGDHDGAARVAGAGLARIAGARNPGMLAAALSSVDGGRAGVAARALRGVDGVEELSAREVEVLRALAGSGSLREVADALYISRNTIKTHTRALYAKLGVGTREEAVRRGRELGLLARVGPTGARW